MSAQKQAMNPEPVRFVVIASVIAAIAALVPIPAWIVDDFYSRDMYMWLQKIMTGATNILPFALLDLILVVTALAVLRRMYRLYHVARQRGLIDALWEALRRVVRAAAILVILFLWAWGFNYRRLPLENAISGGIIVQPAPDALRQAYLDSAGLAARLRPLSQPEGRLHSIVIILKDPMNAALLSLSRAPIVTFSDPKHSLLLSPYFTAAGVTGMLNPLGLETILLPDLLPYERPFVLAHEWAHLSGHADEAEASALGWYACMKGDPTLAYSASLYLMMETAAAMPAEIRKDVSSRVDPAVRSDLEAIAVRMSKQSPDVQRTASRVYDEYLRANRVADGTASYSRALQLILSPKLREALSGYTLSSR